MASKTAEIHRVVCKMIRYSGASFSEARVRVRVSLGPKVQPKNLRAHRWFTVPVHWLLMCQKSSYLSHTLKLFNMYLANVLESSIDYAMGHWLLGLASSKGRGCHANNTHTHP